MVEMWRKGCFGFGKNYRTETVSVSVSVSAENFGLGLSLQKINAKIASTNLYPEGKIELP